MISDLIISSLIIGASIITTSILFDNGGNYEFVRQTGSEMLNGFSVLNNKKTGESCLLKEGAVNSVENWKEMALQFSIPINLCK